MSGHSHYDTIHRQKELKDAQKGKVFSKLAKEIVIAIKTGGGPDPDTNFKLRVVIDKARAANMPKDNVDRALTKAQSAAENIEETTYEGFGPVGMAVMVTVATDNKNRTGQVVKNIFERVGGNLGGPGSVSFNFVSKGYLVAKKEGNPEELMLELIDLGAEDVEEMDGAIEVYTAPDKLSETRKKIEDAGFAISDMELYMKPVNVMTVTNTSDAKKCLNFLDDLNDNEDVQKVSDNLDIPEDIQAQITE
jgi:YebC/PmpR family DNA-binding regulatory protein